MTVLVVAPHPDDESIGCGGAILLHTERGEEVSVVFLTSGEAGLPELAPERARALRESEARAAAALLGVHRLTFLHHEDGRLADEVDDVAAELTRVLDEAAPSLVYVPHGGESHPDHAAAARCLEAAVAAQRQDLPTAYLAYEVWSPLAWFDHVEDISAVMERKLAAIRCHGSQVERLPFDRAALGLGLYRGAMSWGCEAAEVFRYLELTASRA